MTNVLVAATEHALDRLMSKSERQRLESIANVTWRPDVVAGISEDEYVAAIAECRAEIVMIGWGSPNLSAGVLETSPTLKCLVNIAGSVKHYVERECIENGLIVTHWGDVPAASVAEAALMMILASLRRAYYYQKLVHEKKGWRDESQDSRWVPQGLFGKTVGLYGYGFIARALVPMLLPFEPEILVHSSWIEESHVARYGLKPVGSLKDLFARSDIVSVHTGNRPDTFHSVNAEMLSAMKDGGLIVNTARGAIIDTEALVAELRNGRLFAALDVFEQEPLPEDHPLRGLTNCLLFPHQGGPTADYAFRCGATAVDQVERYSCGEELKHLISPVQYDRMT